METQQKGRKNKQQFNNNGQLILVPRKDMYVKHSLSLNDSALEGKRPKRKAKGVTMLRKYRRHSSDPFIHLSEFIITQVNACGSLWKVVEGCGSFHKLLKQSLWKSFFGIFSQKDSDEKDDEQSTPTEVPKTRTSDQAFEALPTAGAARVSRRRSKKRRDRKKHLSRRLSLLKPNKLEDVRLTDFSVEAVMSVDPTYSYYEKTTEDLEKSVHEVKVKEEAKPLTDDEVSNRIIALVKEQGDAIDDKIKDNPTLSNFFKTMTYSSFQRLADAYLSEEAALVQNPPTDH